MENIFIDVLKLCQKAGLIKLGITALDGTKIQGNTTLSSNKGYDSITKEVEKMLSEANKVDAEEDKLYGKKNNGDELPKNLRHREAIKEFVAQTPRIFAKIRGVFWARHFLMARGVCATNSIKPHNQTQLIP